MRKAADRAVTALVIALIVSLLWAIVGGNEPLLHAWRNLLHVPMVESPDAH